MKKIKNNPDETGWVGIPGDTKIIVAHFKDGHKEKFALVDFLVAHKAHRQVVQIDCYKDDEVIN